MKKGLILLFAFVFCGILYAQPQALFSKANTLYQENNFAQAAVFYDSIVAQGFAHAETFYNLGNANYRLGNVGLAILNYEKALKINLADEDALHNLTLANKGIVDEFTAVPTPAIQRIFNDAFSLFSSGIWSIIGLSFFVLMLVFALVFLYGKRQSVLLTLLLLSFILGAAAEGMAFGKYALEQQQFAILTVANSYVKSAPANTAEDLFILHEGTKVMVLDEFAGWQKIKLPDGKIGWMNATGLSVI